VERVAQVLTLRESTEPSSGDDTWTCRRCGKENRYTALSMPGRTARIQGRCECEIREYEEDRAEREHRQWLEHEVRPFFAAMNIGDDYAACSVEGFEVRPGTEAAYEATCRYLAGWPDHGGKGLLYMGDPKNPRRCYGNGKTHLAMAVVNALIDRRVRAVPTTMPYLLHLLRSTYGHGREYSEDQLLNRLIGADLVLIDDLGAENLSSRNESWVLDRLFLIVDARYRTRRPTLWTTNLGPKQVEERVGLRIWDRILERVEMVQVTATSYRRVRAGLEE